MYGMNEQMMHAHQRDYDRADALAQAHEERKEELAKEYRQQFSDLIRSRNLDAPTGVPGTETLADVFSDVVALSDDSIFRALMLGLVHCANKGQIEAIQAIEKVGDYFVNYQLENLQ